MQGREFKPYKLLRLANYRAITSWLVPWLKDHEEEPCILYYCTVRSTFNFVDAEQLAGSSRVREPHAQVAAECYHEMHVCLLKRAATLHRRSGGWGWHRGGESRFRWAGLVSFGEACVERELRKRCASRALCEHQQPHVAVEHSRKSLEGMQKRWLKAIGWLSPTRLSDSTCL